MQKGFSLIELLAAVAITAVLATLAFEPLSSAVARYRVRQAIDRFTNSLDLARTESLRRGSSVVIERLDDCDTRNWSCGWRVYSDANNNASQDANDTLIHIAQPMSNVQVTTNANQLTDRLRLVPNGTAQGIAAGASFFFQPSVASPAQLVSNCTRLVISAGLRWRTEVCP